jgi:hypothetical protein
MRVRTIIAFLLVGGAAVLAQTIPEPGPEVQMVAPIADRMNHEPGRLDSSKPRIRDGTVTGVYPMEGGHDLALFIVTDDHADYNFGSKLSQLSQFVISQPAATSVVAYIANGNTAACGRSPQIMPDSKLPCRG